MKCPWCASPNRGRAKLETAETRVLIGQISRASFALGACDFPYLEKPVHAVTTASNSEMCPAKFLKSFRFWYAIVRRFQKLIWFKWTIFPSLSIQKYTSKLCASDQTSEIFTKKLSSTENFIQTS